MQCFNDNQSGMYVILRRDGCSVRVTWEFLEDSGLRRRLRNLSDLYFIVRHIYATWDQFHDGWLGYGIQVHGRLINGFYVREDKNHILIPRYP